MRGPAKNWTAKAEYLYIDAGKQDIFISVVDPIIHFDNRFHVFRFGVNYRFNAASVPMTARY